MKLRNYITRWQEFHEWSESNRPEILDEVEQLGDRLRTTIAAYKRCSDPAERQEMLEAIKNQYTRVVEWHTQEIISKLESQA